jgi:RND family efflux transporter MFP subunit
MRSVIYLLYFGLVLILTSCTTDRHETEKKEASAVVVKGVAQETVKTVTIPETLEVTGTVRARTSAMVSSRIPGTISILNVREGDRVKKGQMLAQLDARENQATAAAATAGIEEARRGVDEAQTRKKLADVTFERYQRLFNELAVTRQEFDVRQADRELAAQGVARAEARLKQAQEGSRAVGTMADYTRITAPISGVITSRQADLGSTVFPAQPLMTIEDEGSYQLELSIPESVATKIKPGTPVMVALDALNASFAAKIAEVVPASDPASRTFTAKVLLSQHGLRSGMFGRGTLRLGTTASGMLIPRTAVFERGALTAVWAVSADNSARMRLVKPGRITGERVEILSGLSEGDRVVSSGTEKIVEGARIEP